MTTRWPRSPGLLWETLRERDLIARFGGEEFCVLLPGATAGEAAAVAERIRLTVSAQGPQPGGLLTITSGSPPSRRRSSRSSPCRRRWARADRALYQAKLDGRDTVAHGPDGRVDTDVSSRDCPVNRTFGGNRQHQPATARSAQSEDPQRGPAAQDLQLTSWAPLRVARGELLHRAGQNQLATAALRRAVALGFRPPS